MVGSFGWHTPHRYLKLLYRNLVSIGMIEAILESPEALLAGFGIALLGYLIKYREWTFLIAGYDASTEVPKSVAASIVGNLAIRVGIATMLFGVFAAVTSIPQAIAFAFSVLILVAVARAIYRLQTYQAAPA